MTNLRRAIYVGLVKNSRIENPKDTSRLVLLVIAGGLIFSLTIIFGMLLI